MEKERLNNQGITTVAQLMSRVKPISKQELTELRQETSKLGKTGFEFNYRIKGDYNKQ